MSTASIKHARTSHRRSRVGLIAGLVLALTVGVMPLAAATPVQDISHAWQMPGSAAVSPVVPNGQSSPVFVWLSTNDTTGSGSIHIAPKFTVRVFNGSITALPPECVTATSSITQSAPTISNNGIATLQCTLANSVSGNSVRVTVPAVASGWNNQTLQIDSWVGHDAMPSSRPTALKRTISASAVADLRMNHSQSSAPTVEYSSRITIPVPVAITIPTRGAGLRSQASFILTLGNVAGASVVGNLSPQGCDDRGVGGMAGWPAPQFNDSNVKCSFVAYGSGGNQWTVTVTGFNVDPGAAQTLDNRGSSLPEETVHLASFSVLLANSKSLFSSTSTGSQFKFFARADSARLTGADSVVRNDNPTSNNRNDLTYILGGSRSAGWSRNSPSRMSLDGRNVGQEWGNTARPIGNETWMPYVVDTTNSAAPAGTGEDMSVCMVIPGRSDGSKFGSSPGWVYFNSPAGSNVSVDYLTSGMTSAQAKDFDCGSTGVVWKNAGWAPQNGDAQAIANQLQADRKGNTNQWALNHLRWLKSTGTGSLETATVIKLTYTAAHIVSSPLYEEVEGSTYLGAPLTLFTNTPGERVWMIGSTRRHTSEASFYTSSSAPSMLSLGSGDPWTITTMRDMLTMGSWSVGSRVSSQDSGYVGKAATATVTWSNRQNTSSGTDRVDAVATIPRGLNYESSTIAPSDVSYGAGDTTVLTWSNRNVGRGSSETAVLTVTPLSPGNRVIRLQVSKDGVSPASTTQGDVELASDDINVFDSGNTSVTLTANGSANPGTIANGSANRWVTTLTNDDSRIQTYVDTITVLPFNGDGRGSSFTGSYTVSSVTATAGTIYYTSAASASVSDDPDAPSNGGVGVPSSMWTKVKPSTVTAVRHVLSAVLVGEPQSSTINWTPSGNALDDKFVAWSKSRSTYTVLPVQRSAEVVMEGTAQLQVDIQQHNKTVGLGDGDQVLYTVTVRNSGDAPATGTQVTNTRLANLASPAWSSATQGTASGDVWAVGTLVPGQQVTVNLAGNVVSAAAGQIRNAVAVNGSTCTITSPQVNVGVAADTDGCDADDDIESSSLKVDIALATKGVLKAGQKVTFTVTARNDGPDTASDVSVAHPSLSGFTMGATSQALGDVASGQQVVKTLTGTINTGFTPAASSLNAHAVVANSWSPRTAYTTVPAVVAGCVVNATVAADTDQCDFVAVEESSALKVDIAVTTKGVLKAGQAVTFTVTVRNDGPDTAATVSILHPSLSGFTMGATSQALGDVASGQQVVKTLTGTIKTGFTPVTASLNAHAVVTSLWKPRTAYTTVPAVVAGCVVNATVAADTDQCDYVDVREASTLQIRKEVQRFGVLTPGAVVKFTVSVRNSGSDTATGVTVTDAAFFGLSNVVYEKVSVGAVSGVVWTVGDMASGAVATATVTTLAAVGSDTVGVTNGAWVASPWNPRTAPADVGQCRANPTGIADDDDQCDAVSSQPGDDGLAKGPQPWFWVSTLDQNKLFSWDLIAPGKCTAKVPAGWHGVQYDAPTNQAQTLGNTANQCNPIDMQQQFMASFTSKTPLIFPVWDYNNPSFEGDEYVVTGFVSIKLTSWCIPGAGSSPGRANCSMSGTYEDGLITGTVVKKYVSEFPLQRGDPFPNYPWAETDFGTGGVHLTR